MSLRIAYGSTLKFLRARQDASQEDLGHAIDRSYISRLERGERSVTLDVSHSIAEALDVDPLTLLVLTYAAQRGQTPQQVVGHLLGDLTATGLLESEIPSLSHKASHPVTVAAEELRVRIRELMAEGFSQAEVARRLGVARQTVSNHLKKMN